MKLELVLITGMSGSGKSVMATAVMGLLARGLNAVHGSIELHGESLLQARPERLRELMEREIALWRRLAQSAGIKPE